MGWIYRGKNYAPSAPQLFHLRIELPGHGGCESLMSDCIDFGWGLMETVFPGKQDIRIRLSLSNAVSHFDEMPEIAYNKHKC